MKDAGRTPIADRGFITWPDGAKNTEISRAYAGYFMFILSEDRWEVTDTVHPDRKNIFALAARAPYHVGTIISGSRRKLERFEADVALIQVAPAMRVALRDVAEFLGTELGNRDPRAQELLLMIEAVLATCG